MLQHKRFASFLLGGWLAVSIFMQAAGFFDWRAPDRFLGSPPLESVEQIHTLGRESTRALLRHFTGERNRWYTEQWEWAQLALGLTLLLVMIFGSRPPKVAIGLCLLMLSFVLADRLGLSAALARAGRAADFLPPESPLPEARTFTLLLRVYTLVDLAKIAFGFGMAALLLLRKPADPGLFARQSALDDVPARSPRPNHRTQ